MYHAVLRHSAEAIFGTWSTDHTLCQTGQLFQSAIEAALALDPCREPPPGVGAYGEGRSLAVLGIADLDHVGRFADFHAVSL